MTSPNPLRSESMQHILMRRRVIQSLGLLTAAPWLARAASVAAASTASVSPLPLPLRVKELVNHIGTSVPDVTRSARFYSHLFQGGTILGQEKPALRYEIDFHPGAVSIGPLMPTRAGEEQRPHIDHFCVTTQSFDAAAWRARLLEERVRSFAGGSFVVIGGVSVQLLAARAERPAGAKPPAGAGGPGFNPMAALYDGPSLVSPRGFEHLTLHVADLDAAAALFARLFGLTAETPAPGLRLLRVGDIRVELRQAAAGERPSIKAFAIRVAPFDVGRVRGELEGLGAKVGPAETSGGRTILRFADPDGIDCELWA